MTSIYVMKDFHVEARQFDSHKVEEAEALAEWCRGTLSGTPGNADCIVKMPMGSVIIAVQSGDWVMKYPDGAFSYMNNADFTAKFVEAYPINVTIFRDTSGEWRYEVINANNGKTLLVSSEGYETVGWAEEIARKVFPSLRKLKVVR